MELQDFTYDLPRELIAQYPLKAREKARLMVIDRVSGTVRHDIFSNIDRYLPENSCLVLNDSKVIPARLIGERERTGGRVEIFLLNRVPGPGCFEAMISPLNKLKLNERIVFKGRAENGHGRVLLIAEILDKNRRIVRFNKKNIEKEISRVGHMPLPPYIKRPDEKFDRTFYQTVYAKRAGSIAAPTAGLHFTKPLLTRLKRKGHTIAKVTLHVNQATFKPVKENDITKHKMHFESFEVAPGEFNFIQNARKKRKKIIAVGTTSCRVLETLGKPAHPLGEGRLEQTNIFIYPGYRFKMTDCLITNFHLPRSTLLMLVYAFGKMELMRRVYREAIEKKYRFFSYGDAMLIL